MTKTGLIVMPPDMSLRDAGLLLRAASVTGAPVIEDGRLVGVVSRNDLLTGLLSIPLDAKQEFNPTPNPPLPLPLPLP